MDIDLNLCSSTDFKSYVLEFEYYFGKLRSTTDYELIKRIGDGASGLVHKAKLRSENKVFAIKRPRRKRYNHTIEKEEFRELVTLKLLDHENIIKLCDVIIGSNYEELSLVFEYCAYPLASFIELYPDEKMNLPEAKSITKQLFKGLRYLHNNLIIHRDIKVSNLMINELGILKIIDLGTCRRQTHNDKCMSPGVGTRNYKSPEILFEFPNYGFPVDVWSAGCVIAEVFLRKPIFPANSDIHMINLIIELIGSPKVQNWPGFKQCKLYKSILGIKRHDSSQLKERYHDMWTSTMLDLLCNIFVYDPDERWNVDECLNCDWLQTAPFPPAKIEIFPDLRIDQD